MAQDLLNLCYKYKGYINSLNTTQTSDILRKNLVY